MVFEEQTEEAILKRMMDRIPNDLDKRENSSIIFNAIAPTAVELARIHSQLNDKLRYSFLFEDTPEEYIEQKGIEFGITRKQATRAIKKGMFYNNENKLLDIPLGSRFSIEKKHFKAIEKIETGIYKMECEQFGSIGNSPIGNLVPIEYIEGLSIAELTEVIESGKDIETREELRLRILQRVKNPPGSGNKNDYIRWAMEIEGVKNVKIIPLWNGGGTVKVVIAGEKGTPLDDSVINKVKNYIDPPIDGYGEGKAPIGADVTVVTPVLKAINITVVNLNTDNLQLAIQNITYNVGKYLENVTAGTTIRLKDIEAVITNSNYVKDYSYILLNGDVRNVLIDDESKPIVGIVDFTEDTGGTTPESSINKIIVLQSFASLDNVILKHGIYTPKEGGIKC